MNFKNDSSMLRDLCLCLVFLLGSYASYSQETSNLEAIEKVKTTKSKKFIERTLVGNWTFVRFLNADGSPIMNPQSELGKFSFVVDTSRPDVSFFKKKKYEFISQEGEITERGSWGFDSEERELHFQYDEPKYSVPIDKMSDELKEQLKKSGGLIEFTENSWIITDLTNSKLLVLEHLPHDEFDLKYILREYIKK